MASISVSVGKRKTSYRAVIRREGYPCVSRTFSTREEAVAWAENIEAQMAAKQPVKVTTVSKSPSPRYAPGNLSRAFLAQHAQPKASVSGIYFLLLKGEVVYVGRSTHMRRRIVQHENDGREFDSFYLHPCPPATAKKYEQAYISRFDPPQNRILKPATVATEVLLEHSPKQWREPEDEPWLHEMIDAIDSAEAA